MTEPATPNDDRKHAKDPVKRRWMIVGGTIVALAAGGGATAAAADTEGTQSAAPNVVRIDAPRDERGSDAGVDPSADNPLADRLGRLMG